MKNVTALTIDFDVYCDMSKFLPGDCGVIVDWVTSYTEFNDTWNMFKFNEKEFQETKEYLKSLTQSVYISEGHQNAYHILPRDSNITITNLDFHDDFGMCNDSTNVECGSWITALEWTKGCDVCVDWRQIHTKGIGRATEYNNQNGRLRFRHSLGFNDVFNKTYDYVFLCQSRLWSPAHTYHRFRELVDSCKQPVISKDNPPVYRTFTYAVNWCRGNSDVYIIQGNESDKFMDDLYDDEANIVVDPSPNILKPLTDIDPWYLKEEKE